MKLPRAQHDVEPVYSAAYVRRLIWTNWIWLGIFISLAIAATLSREVRRFRAHFESIYVVRERDGGVTFSSSSDGPFVVTHLVYKHWYVARLPEPVVMLESGHSTVSASVVQKLIWHEHPGGEERIVKAPPKDAPLAIFYYKALKTTDSE